MSAATSRYEVSPASQFLSPAPLQRGNGAVEIVFARRGPTTALSRLYQRSPARVLFPHPEPSDARLAVLLTTSGGLTGGDKLSFSIAVDAGAAATIATAAAEKIYRSLGPDCTVEIALNIGEGAWLEWLPQETILFEGARLRRGITARVAETGRLLAAEMLVFGRVARGERFAHGLLHESWRIERGGKLTWIDATRLEGDIENLVERRAGFAGAQAFATAAYVGADAERHLALARALTDERACRAGATLVNGVLLARFIGGAEAVRAGLWHYVAGLRHAAAGLPARPPLVSKI
jgi:urease accessory protein